LTAKNPKITFKPQPGQTYNLGFSSCPDVSVFHLPKNFPTKNNFNEKLNNLIELRSILTKFLKICEKMWRTSRRRLRLFELILSINYKISLVNYRNPKGLK